MKHDPTLHSVAQRLVGQCAAPTPREPVEPRQTGCRQDFSYEPHCLMAWEQMVAGMDDQLTFEVTR